MALTKVIEKRSEEVPRWVHGGGDAGSWFEGTEVVEFDVMTGWQSEETGAFYELGPAPRAQGFNYGARQAQNDDYTNQRFLVVQQEDWQEQMNRERVAAQERQAQERAVWQSQMHAQAEEFNRTRAELARQVEQQQAQFVAEREAREQAKVAAEQAKQQKLAVEAKISGATLLGDMQRTAGIKENDLVASEDKRTLGVEDKDQLFSAGQQDEQEQIKKKQSFLEQVMSSRVTGAPKQ